MTRIRAIAVAALGLLATAPGCRTDMYDQPKYDPLEPGSHLIGPTSALPLPLGTVARSERRKVETIDTGLKDGKLAEDLPFPLTKQVLLRGQDRYRIYCTPCHAESGNGRGMIVERGFSPPPSLHIESLREAPLGHFYDVITNGHGAMYSYAARIDVEDRWAIAAYIRALQWSRNAPASELSAEDRAKLPKKEARR